MKHKLKQLTIIGILVFGLALLLQNCETNDENNALPNLGNSKDLNLKTVSFQEAKSFFDVKDKELKTKRKQLASKSNTTPLELTPNWQSIGHEELYGIDQAQLTLTDVKVNRKGDYTSKLFFINLNNETKSVIFTIYPMEVEDDGKIIKAYFFYNEFDGTFIDGYKIENGEITKRIILEKKSDIQKASFFMFLQSKEDQPTDDLGGCWNTDNLPDDNSFNEVYIFTYGPYQSPDRSSGGIDAYTQGNDNNNYSGGGGGSSSYTNINSVAGSMYTYAVREKQLAEGETECPEGYINNNGICVFDDKIDDSQLTGKEKCLHDLLNKNGNTYIKNLLAKFQGESEFDIIIKSVNELISPTTGNKDSGQTLKPNSNNEIIIKISISSVGSKSALETAKTILHEYIHADIYRKLLTKDNTSQEILNFRNTYNRYKEQFKDKIATTQHQTMGYLYINSMRDALKSFHKNVLKSDYTKYTNYNGAEPSDLFYEALAWRGLKEHNVEAYKDIAPNKITQLEAVDIDIDILTKDCNDAQ